MRRLPLSALQAFEAAARTGSFRAAGEEIGISPSAISHAVRKLEGLMGTALFDREGRAVHLNTAGEALMRHISAGFDEMRQGIETVGPRSGNLLRLHCAPSMAAQWLLPRLRGLLEAQPGLEVRLAAGVDYPRFEQDEFDADICYGPPRQEGLIVIPLGEEVVTPLCAPDLAAQITSPKDLVTAKLIDSDNKRVRWNNWFQANDIAPPTPRGSRFDRSFMAIAAAVDGLGVALESTRLAEREIAAGQLVAPLAGRAQDVRYVGHYLVFPRVAKARSSVRMFTRWLTQELGLPAPQMLRDT
ncbi:LysR substrate-binding domain-containing protein [Bosea sp. BK604]|uniref:LysR substrate-binding domain-containing protein n=1 Tax=Bosea sp. BK604 TaxID=2512180 RepID=UPI0010478248|nr:LysR substrate-binding domain-containing protein [Bosea sp. BK604]TCR70427.1 DNA-binding transcriptional LysR family regulator [Bosea sp. BK604]